MKTCKTCNNLFLCACYAGNFEELPKIVDGMEIQYSLGHRKSEVYSDDFIDPIDFITGKK